MHLNITTIYTTLHSDSALFSHCIIIFFRSGKLVPGLVKNVTLPDRMSCKVWRTFMKTVLPLLIWSTGSVFYRGFLSEVIPEILICRI